MISPPFMLQSAARVAAGDPSWTSVVLLAGNENGPDAGTTFDDASNSNGTPTVVGNTQWDTAQAPTGMTSSVLFDGVGDRLAWNHVDYSFPGILTVELFVRVPNTTGNKTLIAVGNETAGRMNFYLAGATPTLDLFSVGTIASGPNISIDTWTHIAWTRNGSDSNTVWTAGSGGTAAARAGTFGNNSNLHMGAISDNAAPLTGWECSVRVTKGVARYTANFTPPTLPMQTS